MVFDFFAVFFVQLFALLFQLSGNCVGPFYQLFINNQGFELGGKVLFECVQFFINALLDFRAERIVQFLALLQIDGNLLGNVAAGTHHISHLAGFKHARLVESSAQDSGGVIAAVTERHLDVTVRENVHCLLQVAIAGDADDVTVLVKIKQLEVLADLCRAR